MKMEIKAASAFYFNYPAKEYMSVLLKLDFSFKLLVK